MTQHINLLIQRNYALELAALRQLVLPALVVLAVLLAVWGWRMQDEKQARQSEQVAKLQVEQARARLTERTKGRAGGLEQEIAAIKPKAEAAQQVLGKLAELGSRDGYSPHLAALASVGEDGLWITSVEINDGGKSLSLSGQALDQAAVLRYLKKLNARFADLQVEFRALELAAAGKGAPGVVTFRIN